MAGSRGRRSRTAPPTSSVKDSDRREQEVERSRAVRDRGDSQIDYLAGTKPEHGVPRDRPGLCRMQRPDHVRHALDGRIIDREQHIATCEAYNGCGSPFRDIRHHHAFRPLYPQHAIFHLAEARPRQACWRHQGTAAPRRPGLVDRAPPTGPRTRVYRPLTTRFSLSLGDDAGVLELPRDPMNEQTIYHGAIRHDRRKTLVINILSPATPTFMGHLIQTQELTIQ